MASFQSIAQTLPHKGVSGDLSATHSGGKLEYLMMESFSLSRQVMRDVVDRSATKDASIGDLISNIDQISDQFRDLYGEEKGQLINELLYSYTNFSIEVFSSAAIDSVVEKKAIAKWYKSAALLCDNINSVKNTRSNELKLLFNKQINSMITALHSRIAMDFDAEDNALSLAYIEMKSIAENISGLRSNKGVSEKLVLNSSK
jgi:hypothetical protein